MNKYFALTTSGREATVTIYGDITSWPWLESDVSSYNLSQQIAGLDVDTIHVRINSYGGELAEGMAIYSALRAHPATIKTYCDGFACSAASLIFMAGAERIMSNVSLLFIHNAWTYAAGNADDLRKEADDLETMSTVAANAYRAASLGIDDAELAELLAAETWLTPESALQMGFATAIMSVQFSAAVSADARKAAYAAMSDGIRHRVVAQTPTEGKPPDAETQPEPPKADESKKTFFNF